jgi:hypothetical protein
MSTRSRAPRRPALAACAALLAAVACDEGRSQGAAVHPAAAAGGKTREWRHPLGAVLAVPESWETIATCGSSAFAPPDAKREDGVWREIASFVFLPAAGIERVSQAEFWQGADAQMATLAQQVERVGAPQRIDLADRPAIVLHYDLTSAREQGRADLYATLHDGLAVGLLVMGERDRLAADAEQVRALFASLRLVEPQRDPALASRWTRGESYVSGTFSVASETSHQLDADGRWTRRSDLAGGDASSSFDTDDGVTRGRWYAGNGALLLRADDGALTAYRYQLVDGTLVLHDEAERRTLWE